MSVADLIMRQKKEIISKSNNFKEAIRYYKNAKSILRKAKIEDGYWYTDRKVVQEAAGVCYLSVLKALDGYFLQYKVEPEKLPKSYDEYLKTLKKVTVKNGKLIKIFKRAYNGLHIECYYKGVQRVDMVKLPFSDAKWIIEHLTGKKV